MMDWATDVEQFTGGQLHAETRLSYTRWRIWRLHKVSLSQESGAPERVGVSEGFNDC
jgi:hypothetical protein